MMSAEKQKNINSSYKEVEMTVVTVEYQHMSLMEKN